MLIRALVLALLFCGSAWAQPTSLHTPCHTGTAPHGTGVFNCASVTTVTGQLAIAKVVEYSSLSGTVNPALSTFSDSGGVLVWTKGPSTLCAFGDDELLLELWTAPVGTGATVTVSADWDDTDVYGATIHVISIPYDTGDAIDATTGQHFDNTNCEDPASGAHSISLSGSPDAGAYVIGAAVVASVTLDITPSGYTELSDVFNADAGYQTQTQYRTGSTSTAVAWTDVTASSAGPVAGVGIEINQTAASGAVSKIMQQRR